MSTPLHRPLLAAALAGDEAALAALVRLYHDRVYRFGLRVCSDAFDADDAVQEAFIKLAKRPDVLHDPSALSWLLSVVRNTCRQLLRPFTRQRQALGVPLADGDDAAAPALDPQQALERWELVARVHAGISALDPSYREVLILRDVEGLSGEEASRALGLELSAQKSRLHRARTQLRAWIRDHAEG